MPKVKGSYIASRTREIQSRSGVFVAHEVAFIPSTDPNGFPKVLKVAEGMSSITDALASGEAIEMTYITTPPYGDELVTLIQSA